MGWDPKVLVVDDEPELLDLIAEFLSMQGHKVLRACDGEEGLRLFHAERPHLVLTDLQMPKVDGLTLMKSVKDADPKTEILIITGHADLGSAIQAVRQGAFDYFPKPLDLEALGRRVNQALERYRLVSERETLLEELEDRVRARTAALAESQRRLSAVFNGIRDSLVIVDRTFTIVAANEGAAALCGAAPGDPIGRNCYRELFGREEICEGCPVRETFATGRAASRAMARRNPDGSLGYLEVSAYPLAGEGERPQEVVEHIRDFTQKIHQARHLRNAEKLAAVGRLASGLAHELGNGLAIIRGSAQFLLGYPGDRRRSREYLEVIERNVTMADASIRQLMNFARPREPHLRLMDVTEGLEQACLLLKGELAKHDVEVVRQYAPVPSRIRGDPEQLQQVFLNLLLNAIQAMEEGGGTITIRAAVDLPEWVRVELSDTGRGVSREHLDRIFDPFFTTREGGTGLGLSIAHRHVEAHRGRLTVESQEGQGTRVTLLFPAVTPEQGQAGIG